jgi:curli biogenesis system outer membrane secretion channel CsgG
MKNQKFNKILLFKVILLFICFGFNGITVCQNNRHNLSINQDLINDSLKIRIAVAQFRNNTGDLEANIQRISVEMQAQLLNMSQNMMDYTAQMIPYTQELMEWNQKVTLYGIDSAGPPPKAPEIQFSSSPYLASVTDPIAGGLRDMMIGALVNSNKFVVVERQSIDKIQWEQELNRNSNIGDKTIVPYGEIEGADLLLIGSLNTLEAEHSGGNIGGLISGLFNVADQYDLIDISSNDAVKILAILSGSETVPEVDIKWKKAFVAMDIRLIDVKTSRIVAATTIEGKAAKGEVNLGKNTDDNYYTYDELPSSFKFYRNTPIENAFRKMVNAAVNYLVTFSINQNNK